MTADTEAPTRMLPLTDFLIANDVPKDHRSAACASFAMWMRQYGEEGNAPLALLHMAEALKAEQKRADELAAVLTKIGKRAASNPDNRVSDEIYGLVAAGLSGGVV